MKTLMKRLLNITTALAGLALFHFSAAPTLAQSTITAYAGAADPNNGAQATAVNFVTPVSVTSDGAGGFYLATGSPQHSVYRVAADGKVTLIAGTGTSGYSGDGGPATAAQLFYPTGIARDGSGNLFIADSSNNRIRKITPLGVISTFAGNGEAGFSGDGGPATSARLRGPRAIAVDSSGNLFIADSNNFRIRKVTPEGIISTVAGNGAAGFSGDGGSAPSAQLSYPSGIAVDGSNNLLIADSSNYRIRKVTPGGIISTAAGIGTSGFTGDGGPATSARLGSPGGVAVDGSGNLLIADSGNGRVRKVTTDGVISTVAGIGGFGFGGDDGPATAARLAYPVGVAADGSGNLLIADYSNNRIRKVTAGGIITTVAGNGGFGFGGDGGDAISALLYVPAGIAFDSDGNLFIADSSNSRVRKVTPAGVITTIAGNGAQGTGTGDGGPATSARMNSPGSVAVSADGSVYIADCNNSIRKVGTDGIISTFASSSWQLCIVEYYYYDLKVGGLAFDTQGNLFVAAPLSNRIYKVTPSGVISVVAGTGTFGFAGDGGPATAARLAQPLGIAMDSSDSLYIADGNNNRIRKVTPDGIITTVVGNGTLGFDGDGGVATSAKLYYPTSVAVAAGNLFIADAGNYRIRKVAPDGIITTVAGTGAYGSRGDGGPPTLADLSYPTTIAVNAAGTLFIADSNNHRIRKVVFALTVPTLTGLSPNQGAQGATVNLALDGTSLAAPLIIDAGTGITVSNVKVLSETQATATLTIAPDVPVGPRNINVTTSLGTSGNVPLTVVMPYPDLSITSSHTGNLGVGFNENLAIAISNVGSAPTTSEMTITDTLPTGLTFVSGNGTGWSCSAADQVVNCVNPASLPVGASTTLNLVVAVSAAAFGMIHAPRVDVPGDPILSNNSASDTLTTVAPPTVILSFNPLNPLAGSQATLDLRLNQTFPHDVTGTVVLAFTPSAVLPSDDPAIQFASGGRTVTFTVLANTIQARFGTSPVPGPIGFQTGTVAGTLSFEATLQTGIIQSKFATSRAIPRLPPTVKSVRTEGASRANFRAVINLFSTAREVTQLILRFETSPSVRLSCGDAAGCSASGNTLTLDVKSMFDEWFNGNPSYGSTGILLVPLSIGGNVKGTAVISLRNAIGTSSLVSLPLP